MQNQVINTLTLGTLYTKYEELLYKYKRTWGRRTGGGGEGYPLIMGIY